jgi:hypothetical protein
MGTGADEFAPKVMVFDETAEDKRLTVMPHLVATSHGG